MSELIFGYLLKTNKNVQYQTKRNWFFLQTREKLQQWQQQRHQQQQNDYRLTEEIQSASSDSMPEIAITYQPHQPPKTFHFPETVYGKQKRFRHWEYFLQRK